MENGSVGGRMVALLLFEENKDAFSLVLHLSREKIVMIFFHAIYY